MDMYSYNLYVRVSSQFLFIYIKFIQIPWVPVYSSCSVQALIMIYLDHFKMIIPLSLRYHYPRLL